METLGGTVFHVFGATLTLLAIWLAMGKRQISEMTPFDFIVSITAGAIAGTGIADPRIELSRTIVALAALGLMQILLSFMTIKSRAVNRKLHYEPSVLVQDGQIIKENLRKVRLPVELLLSMLREKGVFDVREVELAIFEPQGQLSVIKKPQYAPLTPAHLKLEAEPNRILMPVILEGELQEQALINMGFTQAEIEKFRRTFKNKTDGIFIVFMDRYQSLHVIRDDVKEDNLFMH